MTAELVFYGAAILALWFVKGLADAAHRRAEARRYGCPGSCRCDGGHR